jgi:transcriptional regulator with XRE-family HTH domain
MAANVKFSAIEGVMPYSTLVGKVIEARRIERQLNQATLASALNIGQSAYSRLEAGQAAMTLAQLSKIAEVLGEPPGSILVAADRWAADLQQHGVSVPADKQDNKAALLIGLGLLLALMAKG